MKQKMKKLSYYTTLFIFFVFGTQKAFSQLDNGKYTYKNAQGMLCALNVTEDGQKVHIELNLGKIKPNKILKGNGEWFQTWYQISTDLCSIDFDSPKDKIKIHIYDVTKTSGLKDTYYILTKVK